MCAVGVHTNVKHGRIVDPFVVDPFVVDLFVVDPFGHAKPTDQYRSVDKL